MTLSGKIERHQRRRRRHQRGRQHRRLHHVSAAPRSSSTPVPRPPITVANPDTSTHTATWSGGGLDIDTTSGNGVERHRRGLDGGRQRPVQRQRQHHRLDGPGGREPRAEHRRREPHPDGRHLPAHLCVRAGPTASGLERHRRGRRVQRAPAPAPRAPVARSPARPARASTSPAWGTARGARYRHERHERRRLRRARERRDEARRSTTARSPATATPVNKNGLELTDLKGVSGIKNTTVSGSGDFNALLNNSTSTALDLTVTGNTFSGRSSTTGSR